MFGRKNIKYTAIDKTDDSGSILQETVEFEPMKRKFCTPSCLWSAVFTGALIGTYYIPSVGLTFYQRWLLQRFPFPLLTVLVHMIVKFILAALVRLCFVKNPHKQRTVIGWKEYVLAVAPTGLFSGIDIGFSNWGLELITVSLYTMTKSTTIVFILFFSILFKLEKKSWSLCGIVLMITAGLILFTYKSTQFNFLGFSLLLIASISSGLRWTCVQLLLQKSKLGMNNPIDMIYHMQPWMIASVLPFALWNEGFDVIRSCQVFGFMELHKFLTLSLKVLLGAFIAFFMEFSEVTLVTYTSSLTLAIAGIFKEVFILALAVEMNGDIMSPLNMAGLFICLCGISGHVIHKIKSTPQTRQTGRVYEHLNERYELGENLIEDLKADESNDEKSDTEVLFDILSREKRYSF
ncbi:solute carrier family 35 member C2 [Anthonomus grandis grandis]|uniref:solute carrier family 35 member C2 n=1 Tax=Anthonomus grandis grandis TaxID=2921223 RepID=UPI00216567AF|nr:solute carrier family 35 member C2 [Anthonomus grandis grandis]